MCRVLHSFGDMTFTGLLIPVRKNDITRRFSNAIVLCKAIVYQDRLRTTTRKTQN